MAVNETLQQSDTPEMQQAQELVFSYAEYLEAAISQIAVLKLERDGYLAALQTIALGQAVNPQGFAMRILDSEQTAQRYHRPEGV